MPKENDLETAAIKKAAKRIGAVAGAGAGEIVSTLFANWARENPEEAEQLFARVMSLAVSAAKHLDE